MVVAGARVVVVGARVVVVGGTVFVVGAKVVVVGGRVVHYHHHSGPLQQLRKISGKPGLGNCIWSVM